jgi:hypothetical protein
MTVQQLKGAIVATGTRLSIGVPDSAECRATNPAPIIDAHAALLSLDEAGLPTAASARVRKAILDVTGDGKFDATDLDRYLAEFVVNYRSATDHGPLANPSVRDWGRYDLNGDGFSGGSGRQAFDLDRVGSTRYGAARFNNVTLTVEGTPVGYDELQLTDLEILCYYAYSALWQGTAQERTQRIHPTFCGAPGPFDLRNVTRGLYVAGFERIEVVAAGPGGGSGPIPGFTAAGNRLPIVVMVQGNTFTTAIDVTFPGTRITGTWRGTIDPVTRSLVHLEIQEQFYDPSASPQTLLATLDLTIQNVPLVSSGPDQMTWVVRGTGMCGLVTAFSFRVPAGVQNFFPGPFASTTYHCNASSEFSLTLRSN